jgi:hypothetical protein
MTTPPKKRARTKVRGPTPNQPSRSNAKKQATTPKRVYIETTIVSYLTARPSRDVVIAGHQQVTREWWDTRRAEYELCVSQLVLQ